MSSSKKPISSLEKLFSRNFQEWVSDTNLSSFKNTCYDYVRWQDKAIQFYSASRTLFSLKNYSPAGFCAFQFVENILKATIMYYDGVDYAESFEHKIKPMERHINNKIIRKSSTIKPINIPEYFVFEKRYQQMTRYPRKGKGIIFREATVEDIDKILYELICLVPFQFNTQLIKMINKDDISIKTNNKYLSLIKKYLLKCQLAPTADETTFKLMNLFSKKE